MIQKNPYNIFIHKYDFISNTISKDGIHHSYCIIYNLYYYYNVRYINNKKFGITLYKKIKIIKNR